MAAELTLSRPTLRRPRRRIVVHQAVERGDFARSLLTLLKVAAVVLILGFVVVGSIALYSYINFSRLIDQQIAGGYLKSHAGLYAAPRVIEKGARLSKDQLVAGLQTAGYGRDTASNIWNGSFQVGDSDVRILPRQGTETHEWIHISFNNQGYVSNLSANDNPDLPSYSLEPELLTTGAAVKTGEQQTLTYQDIPPVLVQAILSIEDRRFFEHNGIDIRGIGRALVNATTSGSRRFRQGGSTITQQLVKNTYLTPERTVRRKFNEAIIAMSLENRLSKQDIFALYCNEIYMGQRSGVGVRGVAQAARVFFGKDLKDLSLGEAATIAGMIQSPARYAPDKHPDQARGRRDEVIAAMIRDEAIDPVQAQMAQAQPVQVAPFQSAGNEMAPYYVDLVNRALEESPRAVHETEHALRVQTTIDPDLQSAAELALVHQLETLGKSSKTGIRPQGAMVALDPHTGRVLAMVGGRSYAESQLNRATDAKRQPGSVFKPFVYAAALEAGISPLSTYVDAPQTFQYGNATYSPDNYGKSYSMHDVLMRDGLVRSLNVVTVNLAIQTGLARVATTASNFGLPKPAAYPALALGTTEVTPLQVATAYSAFVNDGKMIKPTVIAGVMDSSAETSVPTFPVGTRIIKPTTAYMITDMLSDVTTRGTARRAKASFKNVAIAGKTGTSRDGWFVGYTPNLVCAVWVGYDDNKQLGLTGAEAALPVWIDFVKEAIAVRPSLGGASFVKPAGITTVRVDSETGYLAGPNCPAGVTVSVARQFAPSMECYKHLPMYEGMLLSETTDGEVPTVAIASGPETIEASQRQTSPGARVALDAESEVAPQPERNRPTRKEVNQQGIAVLVNDPVVADKADISSVGRKHR